MKRFITATIGILIAMGAHAQNLTSAQQATLRTFSCADLTTGRPAMLAGDAAGLRTWLNNTSTFITWRADVRSEETGNAWSGTDIDGMAALNMQRLQLLLASAPSGVFDMTRADRRAGFENPFGTNVNNASRVAMRAVWKRAATQAEKALATGTGTDATPGALTWTGPIAEVQSAELVYRSNGTLYGCP